MCSLLCVGWKSTYGNEPLCETGAATFFLYSLTDRLQRGIDVLWRNKEVESQTGDSFVLRTTIHQLWVKTQILKAPMCCVLRIEHRKQQQTCVAEQSNTSWSQMKAHLFLNIFTYFYMYFNTSINQHNGTFCLYRTALGAETRFINTAYAVHVPHNVISFRNEHAHHLRKAQPKKARRPGNSPPLPEAGCQIKYDRRT